MTQGSHDRSKFVAVNGSWTKDQGRKDEKQNKRAIGHSTKKQNRCKLYIITLRMDADCNVIVQRNATKHALDVPHTPIYTSI
jgi:hypothetical protein